MKTLLTAVQQRLTDAAIAGVSSIAEDKGQIDDATLLSQTSLPCVLIDIANAEWSDEAHAIQQGSLQVQLRIAYNTSAQNSGSQYEAFDILGAIHKSLHGWSAGAQYGKLMRTHTQRIQRNDNIREYLTTYSMVIIDNSAMPVTRVISGLQATISQ